MPTPFLRREHANNGYSYATLNSTFVIYVNINNEDYAASIPFHTKTMIDGIAVYGETRWQHAVLWLNGNRIIRPAPTMKIRATFKYARADATNFVCEDYDDGCYSKGAVDGFEQLECDSHTWWWMFNKLNFKNRSRIVEDNLLASEKYGEQSNVHQNFEGAATEEGHYDDTNTHENLLEFAHEFVYGRGTLH